MKKIFTLLSFIFVISVKAQVGINTTNPTATLHVVGTTTLPSGGGSVDLLNQNFNSAYSVIHSNNGMVGCASPATNGWERTTVGNANTNCTSCTGGWLFIYSDESGCGQNATARIDFTTAPTSTSVTISFAYRYNNFGATGDSFRAYLYNNTTNSQVGTNLVCVLTTDANTTYSGTSTVIAGNSYSLRFEYIGDYDYGASIDNVLVTETSAPTGGSYSFRLEDGTQAAGKVMTSDVNGNAYWATPTGSSVTDSQTLSISGSTLTIAGGNSVTLPSGSGSNTYTNGLTLASSVVKLGGTLTQGTTINLDNSDLTFSSNTVSAFPGQIIYQGTNRVMMDTDFAKNYINFGSSAFIDSDDGTTFNDTGNSLYTKDFVAGFYNGSSGGTAISTGSIEYIVDGTNELFLEASGFSPLTNLGADLGKGSAFQSGPVRNWEDVYAQNFVATDGSVYNRISGKGKEFNRGLKEILLLEPILYKEDAVNIGSRMSTETERNNHIGFTAENVLKAIPEAVKTSDWVTLKEGQDPVKTKIENPTGIMYNQIIPVTVKAIQEQQVQIEDLKKEIEELKAIVRTLQK